ncbi:N-6 DNA methylase [Chryseobacterium sp. HSC-36S06]|uniref:N-6 DNA methylase n=1 Tax=Chryseobacterium sp. HSC-36S06 TaxID=2910970 RepID=UPI00209FC72F|nr:N-6 DNA methylase [Chryseobacterium sp. HSC-36S06]MCP2036956.1 type I restriction-modification system DNA methylase subunit [Chryseobacterium sp. HSC-36S06]
MANPPYSIKSWDRKSFENDPYGRNIWGTPPQGCADYAFEQHIQRSLNEQNGRSISLWPQGFLDRNSEEDIRTSFIMSDRIEAVIGLGRNLFYNSGMESCLVISRTKKVEERKGKILFINASDLVKKEKTISFLEDHHIQKILDAYEKGNDRDGLSRLVDVEDVITNRGSLNINLYVNKYEKSDDAFSEIYDTWLHNSDRLKKTMNKLLTGI